MYNALLRVQSDHRGFADNQSASDSVDLSLIHILIVVAIILIATFDWNRLKPTINQKVSAELNRPFAIRGDLGVVWELSLIHI